MGGGGGGEGHSMGEISTYVSVSLQYKSSHFDSGWGGVGGGGAIPGMFL